MTDPALSPPTETIRRLDAAHDLMDANGTRDSTPWSSLAGLDPSSLPEQLDRQTSELLAYVQEQNSEIDVRQAELNAKLAQLDNELRAARLNSVDDAGDDLLALAGETNANDNTAPTLERASAFDESEFSPKQSSAVSGFARPAAQEPKSETPYRPSARAVQEFDEVESLVAQMTTKTYRKPTGNPTTQQAADRRGDAHLASNQPSSNSTETPRGADSIPSLLSNSSLGLAESGVDMNVMARSLDNSALESERRLLAERKIELDRRQAVLQRMQDETQGLHREALEMRLVTEQLWGELSDKASPEQLEELIVSLRAQLADHYESQNETVAERRAELVLLKARIDEKQQELREQSAKLQEWVEARHEEIKGYAGQMDARELLLDRREHRLHEEFSKWEAERKAYQSQLKGLVNKLNLGS